MRDCPKTNRASGVVAGALVFVVWLEVAATRLAWALSPQRAVAFDFSALNFPLEALSPNLYERVIREVVDK